MRLQREHKVQQINSLAKGDVLGVLVYWGLGNINIDVDALADKFDANGLDKEKWFLPEIQTSAAFRKAVKQVARTSGNGYMLRPISSDDQSIVWGIVSETIKKDEKDLEYACEAKVTFNKDNDSVGCEGSPGQARLLAEKVKNEYYTLTTRYITNDISRMLVRNIVERMNAIPLRKGGGFYFVAADNLTILEQHKAIVETLGDSELGLIVIGKGDGNSETVSRDTRRHLEDKLASIAEEIEEFKTKPPRKDTLDRRIEEFKSLRQTVEMYSTILSLKVDDLNQGLEDCENVVKQILTGVVAEKEAKAKKSNTAPAEVEEDAIAAAREAIMRRKIRRGARD